MDGFRDWVFFNPPLTAVWGLGRLPLQFLRHFHFLQNVTIVMFQVLDCGLSQSTCPSNSSPMTQRKTRQRRPALVSNPNKQQNQFAAQQNFFQQPSSYPPANQGHFFPQQSFHQKDKSDSQCRKIDDLTNMFGRTSLNK